MALHSYLLVSELEKSAKDLLLVLREREREVS